MFRKFLCSILFAFIIQIQALSSELSSSINDVLRSYDFDRDSVVSISIKDKKTGLTVYEKSPYKYLNPASILKLFTMASSVATLGENYEFETTFYKDKKGDFYLKLSGDPLMTEDDLNKLAQNLAKNCKEKIGKIYIDDTIIDKVPYPDGWTIDDYWPSSPKISPYMTDNNTVFIDFLLDENKSVRIFQKSPYKFSFVNKLVYDNTTNINFTVDDIHNTVNIEGTISDSVVNMPLPVLNPKYFFCKKMNDALNKSGINFKDKFLFGKTPDDAVKVASISRPLKEVIKHTLTTSDNTSAEMVFKVAGAKYAKEKNIPSLGAESLGTTQNGLSMFFDYYANLGLDVSQIKVRDGSGVSRYNALNANWITNALLKLNLDYSQYLPTANEGTLSKRMRNMENKVWLKTGTLTGLSSLAGVIKTKNTEYCFASIIMSYNRNKSLLKGMEDEIIFEVYRTDEN